MLTTFRHFGYMILLYYLVINDRIDLPVDLLNHDSLFQLIADMIIILRELAEASPSLYQDELIMRTALQSLAIIVG